MLTCTCKKKVNTKNNILITQKNQRPLFCAIHPHLKKARYSCTFKIKSIKEKREVLKTS